MYAESYLACNLLWRPRWRPRETFYGKNALYPIGAADCEQNQRISSEYYKLVTPSVLSTFYYGRTPTLIDKHLRVNLVWPASYLAVSVASRKRYFREQTECFAL